ncbi:glutathione S-transferase [Mycena metata]|uniref:glutathione transferase n=1 Tax=Mycena metata TaxID=1033252 RepID=A0AAD7JU80_9AGAR|nr:glutathione S-transferase [Mycena metata]
MPATNPPKPIPPGPNSWKIESLSFPDVKKKPFIDVNPNGRVPAIEDLNTDLTLWGSGAILQYIVERYDAEHRVSYEGVKERHLSSQYLHFQMSGQGPYYSQASWFQVMHPDKIPSVIERYANEIKRVLGVLEGVLAAKKSQWLVGDKMTFADMAFVPWDLRLSELLLQSWDEVWDGAPHVRAWHESMVNLPSWKRSMDIRARLLDEQGLQ